MKLNEVMNASVWADLATGHLEDRTHTVKWPNSPNVTLDTRGFLSKHKDHYDYEDMLLSFFFNNKLRILLQEKESKVEEDPQWLCQFST